jgi:acyl carrier protein
LRDYLKQKLPDYMIPAAFVPLDALPLTPSGKVDRRALLAPDRDRPVLEVPYEAPGTPLEEHLAEIWAEVLGVKRIGIHDNFFALGGHSLLATQVLSRIQEELLVEVPLRTLFGEPTIARLADAIIQQAVEETDSELLEQVIATVEEAQD